MNVCNGMIEKVHPVGQAITLISNKYDLPYEIEKMIQDIIFKNKLPKIDMEDWKSKHYKVSNILLEIEDTDVHAA